MLDGDRSKAYSVKYYKMKQYFASIYPLFKSSCACYEFWTLKDVIDVHVYPETSNEVRHYIASLGGEYTINVITYEVPDMVFL